MKQTDRKEISDLLAGVLAFALLAGCGDWGEKGPESPATTPEASPPAVTAPAAIFPAVTGLQLPVRLHVHNVLREIPAARARLPDFMPVCA